MCKPGLFGLLDSFLKLFYPVSQLFVFLNLGVLLLFDFTVIQDMLADLLRYSLNLFIKLGELLFLHFGLLVYGGVRGLLLLFYCLL